MTILRADLHIHTMYSMDCRSVLEDIVARCKETGINCLAVSDHDSIEGAVRMKALAPFRVIVAEEVLTPHGEVMGLFLKERVPSGISLEEAISRIHAQGGLVNIPHPFDTFRGLRLDAERFQALAPQLDMLEVFNARSPLLRSAKKAREFARRNNLPGTAGSDAHTLAELGTTYVELPEFTSQDDFLQSLRKARIHSRRSSLLVHFSSTFTKLKKAF